MEKIIKYTLVIGLVLGTIMIGSTIFIFMKTENLQFGAIVMLLFGILLLGLSIWQSVKIQISPKKGIIASFEKKLQNIETSIERSNNYIIEKINILKSDLDRTFLKNIEAPTMEELRKSEKVDSLIDQGKYLEAIEIEPDNVIAISRLLKKYASNEDYNNAISLHKSLVKANSSGVGYSTYPHLIFSYDQLGKEKDCSEVIAELVNAIEEDVKKGYGYLSKSQQMTWIKDELVEINEKMKSKTCSEEITNLISEINKTIKYLTKEI